MKKLLEEVARASYARGHENGMIDAKMHARRIRPDETADIVEAALADNTKARTPITQQRVSEILRKDWDPIGLGHDGPKDEYDSYIPQVHEILTNALSDDEAVSQIASYLTWVRIRQMGLSHIDGCRRDARAAVVLVEAR